MVKLIFAVLFLLAVDLIAIGSINLNSYVIAMQEFSVERLQCDNSTIQNIYLVILLVKHKQNQI